MAKIWAIAIASVTGLALTGLTIFKFIENSDDVWQWNPDIEAPPQLIFNDDDNDECRKKVQEYWLDASIMWGDQYKDNLMLQKFLTTILDKQTEYGVDLVNNADFEFAAGSLYMDTGFNSDEAQTIYEYDDEMIAHWGDSSNPEK